MIILNADKFLRATNHPIYRLYLLYFVTPDYFIRRYDILYRKELARMKRKINRPSKHTDRKTKPLIKNERELTCQF